jgi:hypothetical protein
VFPYLPGVADELEHVDLASLASASFAHIDGYRAIGKAAARAISNAAGVPLLLNIGPTRCPLAPCRATGLPRLILQTGIPDTSPDAATRPAA